MIENLDEVIEALGGEVRAHIAKEIAGVKADHAIEVADLRSKLSLAITPDEFDRRTAPLFARLAELENRASLPGPRGEQGPAGIKGADGARGEAGPAGVKGVDGIAGKDAEVDYDRIGNVISVAVEKEVGSIPKPRDGTNGKDGKDAPDVDYLHIGEMIKAAAINAVAAIPKPERGEPGPQGEKGDVGLMGARGPAGERGEKGDSGERGANGEPGARGEKGETGANGKDGIPGIQGECGENGIDGHDVHPDTVRVLVRDAIEDAVPRVVAMIPKAADGKSVDPAEVARLVGAEVTRQLSDLAPYIKGDPGDDGLGFDDLSVSDIDGDGMVTLKFSRGARVREFKVAGFLHDTGVYTRGKFYRRGAIATYAGSSFYKVYDGDDAIGSDPPSPGWRLLCKRGRDAS